MPIGRTFLQIMSKYFFASEEPQARERIDVSYFRRAPKVCSVVFCFFAET